MEQFIQTQHIQSGNVSPFKRAYDGAAARITSYRRFWVTICRSTTCMNVQWQQHTNSLINLWSCGRCSRSNLRMRTIGLVSVVCVSGSWRACIWGSIWALRWRKDMTSDNAVPKSTFASGNTAADASIHGRPGSFEVVWGYSQGLKPRPQ